MDDLEEAEKRELVSDLTSFDNDQSSRLVNYKLGHKNQSGSTMTTKNPLPMTRPPVQPASPEPQSILSTNNNS